jgi:hypothetical protein
MLNGSDELVSFCHASGEHTTFQYPKINKLQSRLAFYQPKSNAPYLVVEAAGAWLLKPYGSL